MGVGWGVALKKKTKKTEKQTIATNTVVPWSSPATVANPDWSWEDGFFGRFPVRWSYL